MRFHVKPGDVPPVVAARRLGLTLDAFERKLPELVRRKFPPSDPTTGNFDLDAIDAWRRSRFPHLFSLTNPEERRKAETLVRERLANL
jgi:hypothetical protein